MKKIYCFINGLWPSGDLIVEALCEDGHFLSQHISSNIGYAKHDIGINSDWKHDVYKKHCPEGFELIWIDNSRDSEEIKAAYAKHCEVFKEQNIDENIQVSDTTVSK